MKFFVEQWGQTVLVITMLFLATGIWASENDQFHATNQSSGNTIRTVNANAVPTPPMFVGQWLKTSLTTEQLAKAMIDSVDYSKQREEFIRTLGKAVANGSVSDEDLRNLTESLRNARTGQINRLFPSGRDWVTLRPAQQNLLMRQKQEAYWNTNGYIETNFIQPIRAIPRTER